MNYKVFNDILNIYENEIRKNTKNKSKIYNFEKYKFENINNIYNTIVNYNNNYTCKYNIFLITKPKFRIVMSLNIKDKVINHYITRNYLIPNLEKYLDDRNVATRKNKGTSYARKLLNKYIEENKKYDNFYILKLDISKYFYTIDHNILKSMLIDKLDSYSYNFICDILSSTNSIYVNEKINKIKKYYISLFPNRKKEIEKIPIYEYNKGLPIGNMTSQFLSIFYLYELEHKIIYDYKIKYYIHYMDDFILIDKDKNKLKKIYKLIEKELIEKYKLKLNKNKCKIVSIKEGFVFLGYRYKVLNKKTIIKIEKLSKKRIIKRIKEVKYLYKNNYINLETFFTSINTFLNIYKVNKGVIYRNINKYIFNKSSEFNK